MKTYYKVSFEYSEGIYCTNMAHAENAADVEKAYSKYTWCSVREAAPYELDEAKAKGMPIIEIEHEEPATEKPAQTESKEEEKKMLRSNSKQARENIRAYIVDHFDGTNYAPDFDYIEQAQKENAGGIRNVDIFSMVAHAIAATFYNEKLRYDNRFKAGRLSRYELFEDWCSGLPSILDTCYYYNRSAVDDLGDILQENDAEKAKYTEQQAEKRLTQLIYREIYSVKGVA